MHNHVMDANALFPYRTASPVLGHGIQRSFAKGEKNMTLRIAVIDGARLESVFSALRGVHSYKSDKMERAGDFGRKGALKVRMDDGCTTSYT